MNIPISNIISPFSTVTSYKRAKEWRFKVTRGGDGYVFVPELINNFRISIYISRNTAVPPAANFISTFRWTYQNGDFDVDRAGELTFDATTNEWVIDVGIDGDATVLIRVDRKDITVTNMVPIVGVAVHTTGFGNFVQLRQGNPTPYYVAKNSTISSNGGLNSYFIRGTSASTFITNSDVLLSKGAFAVTVPMWARLNPSGSVTTDPASPSGNLNWIRTRIGVISSLSYTAAGMTNIQSLANLQGAFNGHEDVTMSIGGNLKSGTQYTGGVGSPISTAESHTLLEQTRVATGPVDTEFFIETRNISALPHTDPGGGDDFVNLNNDNNGAGQLYHSDHDLSDTGGPVGRTGDSLFEAMVYPPQI